MPRKELSREALLPPMAAHVLRHGVASASLRPLARAAGTSDRMLIYHFGNKEGLIELLLEHIADIYADTLDRAFAQRDAGSWNEVVARIMDLTGDPAMEPFLVLWWEIVAGSAQGNAAYRKAAKAMMERLLEWLESQMPAGDPDRAGGARFLLTLIEGALMLRAAGCEDMARAALARAGLD